MAQVQRRWRLATAIGLVLAATLLWGLVRLSTRPHPTAQMWMVAQRVLATAMGTTPSGKSVVWADVEPRSQAARFLTWWHREAIPAPHTPPLLGATVRETTRHITVQPGMAIVETPFTWVRTYVDHHHTTLTGQATLWLVPIHGDWRVSAIALQLNPPGKNSSLWFIPGTRPPAPRPPLGLVP